MIDYKCILFKEPVTMGPKPDLKISGYGLLYSGHSGFTDDEIMKDIVLIAATQKWKQDGGFIENGFWIDKNGKGYIRESNYIQNYIRREYANSGFEYAVGNVRLHPYNNHLLGNLIVDWKLYNRIMHFVNPKDWVVAGTEKADME